MRIGYGLGFWLCITAAHAADTPLRDAGELLKQMSVESGAAATKESPGQALLRDIVRFREGSAQRSGVQAATDWLVLYDRARALPAEAWDGDAAKLDLLTRRPVGLKSVLASLPAVAAWPALHTAAVERAGRQPGRESLALRGLTEALIADRDALAKTLAELDRGTARLEPDARKREREQIEVARTASTKLYGTREQVADNFVASLRTNGDNYMFSGAEIPDLVGLVGEKRAAEIIATALGGKVQLVAKEGDQTRLLARKLALANVASLRVAQWGLVDSAEAAPLYEALAQRFDHPAANADDAAADEPAGMDRYDSSRQTADAYYFLHLVIEHRQADAERALKRLLVSSEASLPDRAIEALQRMGQNEALYQFLHGLLSKQPDQQAWDLFLQEAARTGHGAEALALIDELLARKALPAYLNKRLSLDRANALLALDRIDEGVAALSARLAAPPALKDKDLSVRFDTAIRLAGSGRVLERPEASRTGLDFARAVFALELTGSERFDRAEAFSKLAKELRLQGVTAEVQSLAVAELARPSAYAKAVGSELGAAIDPAQRAYLVELIGLYHAAGRSSDVLQLLDGSKRWGAHDLSELTTNKDSLGVPVLLMAARAMHDGNDDAHALAVLDALIRSAPGYDPAYELYVEIDPVAAIARFESEYARDQFEERPLIWKAIALTHAGRYAEAETTIKAAILIDPSDGEQGPNDRMRAYAVLADILDAKKDAEGANLYRGAVAAIRISERTDELYKLGLFQRAFAGYDEALTHFSEAYCIQSRLAVQLSKQGRHEQALVHYRRAYELMPGSFGRVESHCFGCETVFQGEEPQGVAEQVFTELIKKTPEKAQTHYMLGYLRKEQGRSAEALQLFRDAIARDGDYLNAWRHLHELAEHTYIEPGERDIARLKLLELDPEQRHVKYDLTEVTDLNALWRGAERAAKLASVEMNQEESSAQARTHKSLYPLKASSNAYDQAASALPEAMRQQLESYTVMSQAEGGRQALKSPGALVAEQLVVASLSALLSDERSGGYSVD